MHARCASGRNLRGQGTSGDCRRKRAAASAQIQFKARALLQQALRVAVPSPSADVSHERRFQVQNSGASAAAAGIASGRPVAKCRFAEFRRERCCSLRFEWPSRCQVKICRIQARALLQQALRVAVPLPSADVSHDRLALAASELNERTLPSNVPV
ncbi:hypothetical protein GW17_00030321, partial [Ensete ventricosum]